MSNMLSLHTAFLGFLKMIVLAGSMCTGLGGSWFWDLNSSITIYQLKDYGQVNKIVLSLCFLVFEMETIIARL